MIARSFSTFLAGVPTSLAVCSADFFPGKAPSDGFPSIY